MIDPNFLLPPDFWDETQPRFGDSKVAQKKRADAARLGARAVLSALGAGASFTLAGFEGGNSVANGLLFFGGMVMVVNSLTSATIAVEHVSIAHESEGSEVDCQADMLPYVDLDADITLPGQE